ncbi:peptidylprolyl isomerase [Stigmatella erecta]|uniref:peptidylprolyl isomerase n=1 Tax=Stigmatella erecta TaxID=83460 RepID=A0A1I0K5E0_9BACT|nr:peptidylprolyl isomerase [Stigmatella erecta]SEU18309.1 Peptidyl-prolyl cis-trans isomerase (rotamase)-cyclophilin family [Stigmatella erecta]
MLPWLSRLCVCVVALLLPVACVRAVAPPGAGDREALAQVEDWEDRRSLGDGQLVAWAGGERGTAVRIRALRALARIQDATTLEVILAGLAAAEPSVREEAAFASGELAFSWEPLPEALKARLTEALRAAEAKEQDEGVQRALLEAFSKLGTPGAIQRLIERLTEERGRAGRAALALGVSGRRGVSLAEVPLEPVKALLGAEQPVETRYGAAYLLVYVKRPEALAPLRHCLSDADPDVRALCAKGFGEGGGPEELAALARLLADPTPRVAAEAARTLSRWASACSTECAPLEALGTLRQEARRVASGASASAHAILAVAQQGLPRAGRPVLEALRRALAEAGPPVSETAADDVAWLDCRLAAAMDRQTGALAQVLSCGGGRISEERRWALGLRELAQAQGPEGAPSAVPGLSHPDARVRLAALDAVGARPVPEAVAPVRALLKGDDAVVAGMAAATVGKMKVLEALPEVHALAARVPQEPDLAEPVAGALVALEGKAAEPVLRGWLAHPHANVRRVATEALTGLTGQPVRSARVESPRGTRRPPTAPAGATLIFRTRKGDITVALDAAQAPLTSGNLHGLARQGYFRGVTFHRVVPDFVAQGGDPRGDGEGGPGYSIRCEMTRRAYRRGVIGMALAGKDTGGSQFFFTHAPQPHLDGRYTAFGEVTAGMEVVDALLEGDVILEVRTEP